MKRLLRNQEQGWNKVHLASLNHTGRGRAKYYSGFILGHPNVRIEPDSTERCPPSIAVSVLWTRPESVKKYFYSGCWLLVQLGLGFDHLHLIQKKKSLQYMLAKQTATFFTLASQQPGQHLGTKQAWTCTSRESWAPFWTSKNKAWPVQIFLLSIG